LKPIPLDGNSNGQEGGYHGKTDKEIGLSLSVIRIDLLSLLLLRARSYFAILFMIDLAARYARQAGENTFHWRRQRPPGFCYLRAGEIAKLTWDMVLDPTGDRCGDRVARSRGQERQQTIDPGTP
jgi:hypothetical protein